MTISALVQRYMPITPRASSITGFGDGRIALALGVALDGLAGHGTDEGGHPLEASLGLGRPLHSAGALCPASFTMAAKGQPGPSVSAAGVGTPAKASGRALAMEARRCSKGSAGTVRPPTFTPRLLTSWVSKGLVSMATRKPHSGQRNTTVRESSSGPSASGASWARRSRGRGTSWPGHSIIGFPLSAGRWCRDQRQVNRGHARWAAGVCSRTRRASAKENVAQFPPVTLRRPTADRKM